MKKCIICGIDISHKKSNSTTKCEKCIRILTDRMRKVIVKRGYGRPVKNEVLLAYDTSCAICGWSLSSRAVKYKYRKDGVHLHQRGCEMHHILPVSEGGKDEFENLILLCPNHHKEADLGLISIEYLKSLVAKDKQEAKDNQRLNNISGEQMLDNMF